MDLEFKNMSADLFSGTAWCFSRPACDEKLDYIENAAYCLQKVRE